MVRLDDLPGIEESDLLHRREIASLGLGFDALEIFRALAPLAMTSSLLMPRSDQGISEDRYTVIPRTAIFLRRRDSYLLLKGAPTKRLWANKFNGLGGHIEKGENILASAKRELLEETGLNADLWLCGTVLVDAGQTGICLFVFTGECLEGEPQPSLEGIAEWIPYDAIPELPVVEDLPVLLARIHHMQPGDPPFFASSHYDEWEMLVVEFQ